MRGEKKCCTMGDCVQDESWQRLGKWAYISFSIAKNKVRGLRIYRRCL